MHTISVCFNDKLQALLPSVQCERPTKLWDPTEVVLYERSEIDSSTTVFLT